LEGRASPGDRPTLRRLGQRRNLGPAAPGLPVAGTGAADLGVLRGIGAEVALDGLARPHHILVAELGAVVAIDDLLGQGPVGRLDLHEAGFELDTGRPDLLKHHVGSHAKLGVFLPYADDVIEPLEDMVG